MTPNELRKASLQLLRRGGLTAERLAALAGHRHDLVADLVELPYSSDDSDDIHDIDAVRQLALELLNDTINSGHPARQPSALALHVDLRPSSLQSNRGC